MRKSQQPGVPDEWLLAIVIHAKQFSHLFVQSGIRNNLAGGTVKGLRSTFFAFLFSGSFHGLYPPLPGITGAGCRIPQEQAATPGIPLSNLYSHLQMEHPGFLVQGFVHNTTVTDPFADLLQ